MNLPFFFKENLDTDNSVITLDDESSKHIVQVLRMKPGEMLQLTDGKGNLVTAEIVNDHKKKCEVQITQKKFKPSLTRQVSIAISLLKNSSRFEWFLEKAIELGISEIIPMICERTEKQHFRYERMKSICTSAMLQSQQVWLAKLHEPKQFIDIFENINNQQKFIAHCNDTQKSHIIDSADRSVERQIIFIGPEGDFTTKEIEIAIKHSCFPVSLGETRLRSETAGVVAAAILMIH